MSFGYYAAMPAADHPPAPDWLATDPAQPALRLRARDTLVAADLFRPADARLRDDDRAVIAALLTTLVDRVEQDLRARLAGAEPPLLAAVMAAPDAAIARPILERAGVLGDPALVAVLAQRAAERRLVARLRHDRDRAADIAPVPPAPTTLLGDDPDPVIADAAAALAAAARADAVSDGLPAPGAVLLPAEVQHRLVWRVAAALRDHAIARHGLTGVEIDPPIARAAGAALAGYDEGRTPAGLALALARVLSDAGRLDGASAIAALAAGEAGLAAAMLAVPGGVGFAPAWEMMVDPDPSRLLLLCRAADLPPAVAADIALRLATGEDDEALAARIDDRAAFTPAQAAAGIALWRLDPAYLDAIAVVAARSQP